MKKLMKIVMLATLIILIACDKETKYPTYKIGTEYYTPDSLNKERAQWILEAIKNTNNNLSASEYKEPEDVIIWAEKISNDLFKVRGVGLKIKDEYTYTTFIPQEDMTKEEKQIFKKLLNTK